MECCLKYEQSTRPNLEKSIDYRMLQKLISNAYFEQAGVLAAGSLMGEISCSIIEQNQLIYHL